MSADFYLAWLAVIFPLVYSPGPGNILCAISGATNGARGALPFILGLNLSYSSYSLMAGFGLGAIIRQYETAFYYVQLAGCAYIVYLAVMFFRRPPPDKSGKARRLTFRDGVVSQALNVKGVSIVVLMYSQFLQPDGELLPQVLRLTAMLAALNLFTHASWAPGGAWMLSRLASARAAAIQNRVYGLLLLGVAVWLLP